MNNRNFKTEHNPLTIGDNMKKGTNMAEFRLSILTGLIAIILTFSACGGDDGGGDDGDSSSSNEDVISSSSVLSSSSAYDFGFGDIEYWVLDNCDTATTASTTTKCNAKAMMLVQWNDAPKRIPDPLVWGYQFRDSSTGEAMIKAITKADPRFYLLSEDSLSTIFNGDSTFLGTSVGGIGYAPYGGLTIYVGGNNSTNVRSPDQYGFFTPTTNDGTYSYDKWQCRYSNCGDSVHWQAGWNAGYWVYDTTNTSTNNFSPSDVGLSLRKLIDGSRDAWNFVDTLKSQWPGPAFITPFTPVPKP
jgi:hypothetical protein